MLNCHQLLVKAAQVVNRRFREEIIRWIKLLVKGLFHRDTAAGKGPSERCSGAAEPFTEAWQGQFGSTTGPPCLNKHDSPQKPAPQPIGHRHQEFQSGRWLLQTLQVRTGCVLKADCSSLIPASQSSAVVAFSRDMAEREAEASAEPPPSSEASVMLRTGWMGALKLEKHSGSKPVNTITSSSTSRGRRRFEADSHSMLPINPKISSRTEKVGLRKPAAKQATPAQ